MNSRGGLPPLHLLLALGVMAVWGTNFVVIKLALAHLPPLTLAALRFTLAFLPMALFIKRPQVPDDVNAAALFLLTKNSGFITGQVLPVNGGFVMN